MTRLSVLDQSPIRSGVTAADAVRETLELARFTDRLGYHRYWLAEHHSSGGLAGSSPEILIGHVAAETKDIRVGSGGVMPNHYSALKVAENFRMPETLHPGRIDELGRLYGVDEFVVVTICDRFEARVVGRQSSSIGSARADRPSRCISRGIIFSATTSSSRPPSTWTASPCQTHCPLDLLSRMIST